MSVILLAVALAAEPDGAYVAGDVLRAAEVLARDAERDLAALRAVPLVFGDEVVVIGGMGLSTCASPGSGEAFSAAARDAESYAVEGQRGPARRAVAEALAAAACLDVPLRAGETARLHDLASALESGSEGDRAAAVSQAAEALRLGSEPLAFQVDPEVLSEARARVAGLASSTLWLPPGLPPFLVVVDGVPAAARAVRLTAGAHVLQVLGAQVHARVLQVPAVPVTAALVAPETDPARLDPTDPADRAWFTAAVTRWRGEEARSWLVVDGRVWRHDRAEDAWWRYERRPERRVRPALIGVGAAGVAVSAAVGGVSLARWAALDRCGTEGAGQICDGVVDPGSGLITDAAAWSDRRATQGGWAIAGGVGVALSTAGLVAVAAQAGPRAVRVALDLRPDGGGLRVAGAWP